MATFHKQKLIAKDRSRSEKGGLILVGERKSVVTDGCLIMIITDMHGMLIYSAMG